MSFPITCTACNKTFTISDEIYEKKVAGRVVTIKCKSCGQGIRVDGGKGSAAAAPPAPAVRPPPEDPDDGPTLIAAPGKYLAAVAASAVVEPLWAVDYPDGQDREFTTAEVVAEIERGAIDGSTLVWREGMAEWLELHQLPELAGELALIEGRRKAAASAVATNPAQAHTPRAPMPTVTGLAGLPGAGGTKRVERGPQPVALEPAKPRAKLPSTPELPKPRGVQPSAPILAKPAAPAPPAPSPPAPSVAARPAPPPAAAFAAPIVTPAAPDFAPPAPDLPPPLPASVAKVVSRPPQVPAFPASPAPAVSFGATPVLVADHATVEWPQAKSKTPLVVAGVIAAVVLIGGAVLALSGSDEPPPPATPIAPLTPPSPPAPAADAQPTPATASTAAQSGSDTAAGSDPVLARPDPGATPGAGFAELFAAGARKAESKGQTVAPSSRFDPAATKGPLAEAATQAQACKQSGGPTGKVTVVVTFEPNGKVASATITEAPFAGTAIATCISSALKRAAIPPFSGLPGTVSKTFSIL